MYWICDSQTDGNNAHYYWMMMPIKRVGKGLLFECQANNHSSRVLFSHMCTESLLYNKSLNPTTMG